MTHAAVLQTEQPDLQALFDEDWASGKYRRPKCSKADYYAGWLVAYERFRTVMATEKVAIVEKPAKPARAPQPKVAKEKYEQEMLVCEGKMVPVCSRFTDQAAAHERQCGKETTMHHMLPDCSADGEHNRLVTHYSGGLPLKRISPIKGRADLLPSRAAGCSGQAIPDSMIRKLAIMAGRPEIAP